MDRSHYGRLYFEIKVAILARHDLNVHYLLYIVRTCTSIHLTIFLRYVSLVVGRHHYESITTRDIVSFITGWPTNPAVEGFVNTRIGQHLLVDCCKHRNKARSPGFIPLLVSKSCEEQNVAALSKLNITLTQENSKKAVSYTEIRKYGNTVYGNTNKWFRGMKHLPSSLSPSDAIVPNPSSSSFSI